VALTRLSNEDVRILRLERGAVRGHTCKLLVLGPGPDGRPLNEAALRDHVAARLPREPVLMQRLAPTPLRLANPALVDDPEFDIARHVVRAEPCAVAELPARVAALFSTPLDRDRPLWRLDLIPLNDGTGTALVLRIHHAIADGMAVMRMLSSVLLSPEPPIQGSTRRRPAGAPAPLRLAALGARDRLSGLAGGFAGGARAVASPRGWREAGRGLRDMPSMLRRELSPAATPTELDLEPGEGRHVAFTSISLGDLKAAAKSIDERATVNDAVLCAVAGGLSRWLSGGGAASVRAKVPVSLHHRDERPDERGNHDSFMFVDLPLEEVDAAGRLLAISAQTRERKRHHDAETLDRFLRDVGHVSSSLERLAHRWAMSPRVFTVNVSNVPGPREPQSVLGSPLLELYAIAEVANRHALRVAVISASGRLFFGLCADSEAGGELELLAAGIDRELQELVEPA
jgi:diacylglycerol O-acyltransferase / wax synthase